MNPIEALQASGLNPVIVDEDTDLEEAFRLRRETNPEFVERIMTVGCPTGALVQAFVIEALTHYSESILQWEPTEQEKNGFLAPEAWKATASFVKFELEKKYGKTPANP